MHAYGRQMQAVSVRVCTAPSHLKTSHLPHVALRAPRVSAQLRRPALQAAAHERPGAAGAAARSAHQRTRAAR